LSSRMMLNVSRTPVPESWISSLATKPCTPLDKEAFVTLEKGRFSISTIDSELFPELVSWSTLMSALPHSSAQSIPSDITKPDGTDTMHGSVTTHETNIDTVESNTTLLSSILDPTTLEAGFDQSCFDSLDELLVHDPFEAFLDACWLDAVGQNGSVRVSTPTQLLNKPAGQRKLPPIPVPRQKPEQRDGDVGQTLTPPKIEVTPSATLRPEHNRPWFKQDPRISFSSISDDDKATSFIIFEAPALTPNRFDSIGHFPIPSTRPHRNAVSSRIPTFCTNLPAPFTHVR